jgi:hypothetical protein
MECLWKKKNKVESYASLNQKGMGKVRDENTKLVTFVD